MEKGGNKRACAKEHQAEQPLQPPAGEAGKGGGQRTEHQSQDGIVNLAEPLPQQLRTSGKMLGVLVIHSPDMTGRMYQVRLIRGYSQRISATSEHRPPNAMDFALLAYSALTLVGVFLYR